MLAEPTAAPAGRWRAGAAFGLTLAVIAVWQGVQVAVLGAWAVAAALRGERFQDTGWMTGSLGLLLALSTLLAAPIGSALTVLFARRPPREALALRLPRLRQALLWTLALVAFLAAYDLVARDLGRPLSPEIMVQSYRTSVWPPLFWLAVALAAPIFEELLFRGFLLPSLAASRLGAAGAVTVSSLLFAALHLQYDLFDMTGVFLLGCLFAAARLASGSTLLTIGLHVLTNLLALIQLAQVAAAAA
ncbi:MAG TPA: CPBP family intramembrane glutamic endopeptidase [Thermoanaerobaculia bacterium]|nr:CPBP family intramembrane glutamic endopeptidase [Thermoanaerobaculia bacterium]